MVDTHHVLVTGATGFLGRHLLGLLRDKPGIVVHGVSARGGDVDGIRVDAVDLTSALDVAAWRRGVPRFSAVFHLAAVIPTSFATLDEDSVLFANLRMTQNMVGLAIADEAAFIYASSTSIYGASATSPMTESTPPRPDNLYSVAKYTGELLAEVAHERAGIPTCSLRISAPYGRFQTARTVVRVFLEAAMQSRDLRVFGSGARTQDFTYATDVAEAFWCAYERRGRGAFNVAGGQPISMRDLAQATLDVVPGSRSRVVAAGQEDAQEHYRGVFPTAHAERELGFRARVPLREGLALFCSSLTGDAS